VFGPPFFKVFNVTEELTDDRFYAGDKKAEKLNKKILIAERKYLVELWSRVTLKRIGQSLHFVTYS